MKKKDPNQDIELAHRSADRMMNMADKSPPRKFMLRESSILLRRAFSIWLWFRWPPWRKRGE